MSVSREKALKIAFSAGWATEYYDDEGEEMPGVPDGEGNDCTDDFIRMIEAARKNYIPEELVERLREVERRETGIASKAARDVLHIVDG